MAAAMGFLLQNWQGVVFISGGLVLLFLNLNRLRRAGLENEKLGLEILRLNLEIRRLTYDNRRLKLVLAQLERESSILHWPTFKETLKYGYPGRDDLSALVLMLAVTVFYWSVPLAVVLLGYGLLRLSSRRDVSRLSSRAPAPVEWPRLGLPVPLLP